MVKRNWLGEWGGSGTDRGRAMSGRRIGEMTGVGGW